MNALTVSLAMLLMVGPPGRSRSAPDQPPPERRVVPLEGAIEIALGSLSLGVASVLVGNGVWELVSADALARGCEQGTSQDPLCNESNPVRGHHVAAGLSFAFVVPLVVAGGFALAHGVRKNREARRRLTARWGLGPGGAFLRF